MTLKDVLTNAVEEKTKLKITKIIGVGKVEGGYSIYAYLEGESEPSFTTITHEELEDAYKRMGDY
jgi:hypothetical protein